jgi:hypothetical protein
MNKLVLEKILHTYKLFDADNVDKTDALFKKHWHMPQHFDPPDLDLNTIKTHFQYLSRHIQKCAKFHVDLRGNSLTEEEAERIAPEVVFCLPYEHTFLQFEDDGCCLNILVKDTMWAWSNEEKTEYRKNSDVHSLYECILIPYMKDKEQGDYFLFDQNIYTIDFHIDTSFRFTVEEDEDRNYFAAGMDLSSYENAYTNGSMNNWVMSTASCISTFMMMLCFPQITQTTEVKGVKPQSLISRSRYKHSELRSKPTWEHKTLKIDLYGSVVGGNGTNGGGRSEGTKFHSVRKHLRRLANGNHTFVKAHFRGSKDVGVVQKDYEVKL